LAEHVQNTGFNPNSSKENLGICLSETWETDPNSPPKFSDKVHSKSKKEKVPHSGMRHKKIRKHTSKKKNSDSNLTLSQNPVPF
jgi:hypothetical protein